MMTLKRFRTLVGAYGADPRRWPEQERPQAEMLLQISLPARQILREAELLDSIVEEAGAQKGVGFLHPGEQAAALARLRSGVSARIAPPLPGRLQRAGLRRHIGWTSLNSHHVGLALSARLGWLGMMAGGGIALVAGLYVGSMHAESVPVDVLALLQASPIHGLGM